MPDTNVVETWGHSGEPDSSETHVHEVYILMGKQTINKSTL